jgi:glycosyltransferase involved in cell wall biosynthesis
MLLHKSVEFDSRVRREASTLARAGHDVTVVELTPLAPGSERLDGFARVSAMPSPWVRARLPWNLYRFVFLGRFVQEIVRARPQIVHAHDAAMLLPGLLGARLARARLVYDSHELATSVPYRERAWAWFVVGIEHVVVPRCAAVITVSDGIALRLRGRYGLVRTPTVLRNVSDLSTDGTGGLRAALGIDADTPLVLHQGAPAPSRGCETLLAAVARLAGVHLAMLGDAEPEYRRHLEATVAGLGLGDRVALLPSVPLEQLLAYTAEADVGVSLLQDTCENHRLALPNKLFEYIAAGVPVVASDLPEMRALIERYGVGWSVDAADAGLLAGALARALEHRGSERLAANLAAAAEELRWSRERERLVELYAELQAGPGARMSAPAAVAPAG